MEKSILTGVVIGAAIEVHKNLGPSLLESVYEECLFFELFNKDLDVKRQRGIPVNYKNVKLDLGFRLDLLVENELIIEIKAVESIYDFHVAQILTYMKLMEIKLGLIINFNVKYLKDGIRRLIL